MTINIRQSVFETNSSSTHSICVAKDPQLIIPKELHFEFGEFGWEFDTLGSLHEKASYLFTGLIANNMNNEFDQIVDFLVSKGINITHDDFSSNFNGGYIDHSHDLSEFLFDMTNEYDKLMWFLFSPLSFILTGNDNSDQSVDIEVSYPYKEYYKGN